MKLLIHNFLICSQASKAHDLQIFGKMYEGFKSRYKLTQLKNDNHIIKYAKKPEEVEYEANTHKSRVQ